MKCHLVEIAQTSLNIRIGDDDIDVESPYFGAVKEYLQKLEIVTVNQEQFILLSSQALEHFQQLLNNLTDESFDLCPTSVNILDKLPDQLELARSYTTLLDADNVSTVVSYAGEFMHCDVRYSVTPSIIDDTLRMTIEAHITDPFPDDDFCSQDMRDFIRDITNTSKSFTVELGLIYQPLSAVAKQYKSFGVLANLFEDFEEVENDTMLSEILKNPQTAQTVSKVIKDTYSAEQLKHKQPRI